MLSWIVCLPLIAIAPETSTASFDVEEVAGLLELVLEVDEDTAAECVSKIVQQAQSGELKREQLVALRNRLSKVLQPVWSTDSTKPLHDTALQLAALWNDPAAITKVRQILADETQRSERRGRMLTTLAATGDQKLIAEMSQLLARSTRDTELQLAALNALAKFESVEVADAILSSYQQFPPQIQAQAVTVLTQRPAWSRRLVVAVQAGKLPSSAVGLSHLRSLLASRDAELATMVKKQWGAVRTERNPAREQVLVKMRELLMATPGDAVRGQVVFQKVCGQCHKIHGTGQEVGPDITSNGRSSFDQLLSNVFDPSLVIGPAYQAVTVITVDGRVLTGLLAEDSEQRISLKTQGGKIETIPRSDVEEVAPSKLSLMPENLEQQLKSDELADLFAFLVLDKPPQDPEAKLISGAPAFNSAK
jgi:putative heme-binding domain-containing protein